MTENESSPGRKPRVTNEEIIDVFRTTDDPVLSTAEVATQLPIKRRATLNRLEALEEEGRVDSKTIGGRNRVWWIIEEV
jgi:predicted ArsR family transcriptional regulator